MGAAGTVQDTSDWRIYERVAACFEIESANMDVSVTPNASLLGSISGVWRQIDILEKQDGRQESSAVSFSMLNAANEKLT